MKRLKKTALPRARRSDVVGLGVLRRQLASEFLGDELRAVVGANELRCAVLRDGRLHQSDDVGRTDLTLGSQHMHFLSILIEYGEHAQGTAMNRGVGNTIPGPYMSAMVRLRR